MTARRSSAARQPATIRALDASTNAVRKAVANERRGRHRIAVLGRMGWIGVVITAIREFCKNWPKVKSVLQRIIDFLKKNKEEELAAILTSIVKFLDAVAKVCPLIPKRV